jgi:hypothetical protein
MYDVRQGSSSDIFQFTTNDGLTYEIEFTALDSETFPALPTPARFYLIDVFPLNTDWRALPGEDVQVGQTIASIVDQVVSQNNTAVVYSCETTDGREKARYRKFNQWFSRYNDGTFLKYDAEITSVTKQYFISVLLQHSAESYQLVARFLQITTDWQQRKPR